MLSVCESKPNLFFFSFCCCCCLFIGDACSIGFLLQSTPGTVMALFVTTEVPVYLCLVRRDTVHVLMATTVLGARSRKKVSATLFCYFKSLSHFQFLPLCPPPSFPTHKHIHTHFVQNKILAFFKKKLLFPTNKVTAQSAQTSLSQDLSLELPDLNSFTTSLFSGLAQGG